MSSNQRIQGPEKHSQDLSYFGKVSTIQKECCLGKYLRSQRSIFLLFCVFYGTLYSVTLVPDFQGGLSMVDLDDWKEVVDIFLKADTIDCWAVYFSQLCYSSVLMFRRSLHTYTVPISLMEYTSEAFPCSWENDIPSTCPQKKLMKSRTLIL